MAQAMVSTGSRQRNRTPYSSSFPTRGGSGSAARWRPSSVSLSRPASNAPMSCPQRGQHKHGSDVKGMCGTTVRYIRSFALTMGMYDRRAAGHTAANTGSADGMHVEQTWSRVMAWSTAWLTGGSTALPRKPAMLPGSSAGSSSFTCAQQCTFQQDAHRAQTYFAFALD